MFFKNLFAKPETLLIAEIKISANSSFNLLSKSEKVEDKELILLGLLMFARILRLENSKSKINSLLTIFPDFYRLFRRSDNQSETLNSILNTSKIFSQSYMTEQTRSVKLKRFDNGNIYLDMSFILAEPFASIVHTVFIFVLENLENKENKIRLLEAFTLLCKLYEDEIFSIRSAVDVPNMIVYDTIPFGEKFEFEVTI